MIKAIRLLGGSLWMPDQRVFGDGEPNLLTAPEDFDGTGWAKTATTVLRNAATALDGSLTADKLVATSISAQHYANMVSGAPVAANTAGTFSVFAKSAEQTSLSLSASGSGSFVATFNLATGVVTAQLGGVASIVDFGSGWYRCIFTCTTTAFAFSPYIFPVTYNGYTGDGVSGVYVWGAKLEPGTVATPYTPQSVLSVRGACVDITGTTPVTAIADLLGLVTDRSYGSANLGVNRVTNGDLAAGTAGWTLDAGISVSAGKLAFNTPDATAFAFNAGTVEVNKIYEAVFQMSGFASGGVSFANNGASVGLVFSANGPCRQIFTATQTGALAVRARLGATVAAVDDIIVREVIGSHATQSAVASKPSVRRVPKLLGPNLVMNGDFGSGAAGWTVSGAAVSISGGKLTGTTDSGSNLFAISPSIPVVAGKSYQLIWDVDSRGVGSSGVYIYNQSYDATMNPAVDGTLGTRRHVFTAKATANMTLQVVGGGSTSMGTFDNFEVHEVLEWANVISFDGNNDFLQTGITTGNEGWFCAGVTPSQVTATATIMNAGAGGSATKGFWLYAESGYWIFQVGNGAARQEPGRIAAVAGAAKVIAAGFNATTVVMDVDSQSVSAGRSGDATYTGWGILLGAYTGGTYPLGGPANAFAYTPVLPDAATRKVIRDGIAALQGRGPL